MFDAEQIDDREVLARLRHHPFVRRDHQQREVDPAHAREHVLDEALVPRHVDDAHLFAAGQSEPGEAEVDRQPALLLLPQPVRVDAGKGLDERGLAVVNVAGSADRVHLRRH